MAAAAAAAASAEGTPAFAPGPRSAASLALPGAAAAAAASEPSAVAASRSVAGAAAVAPNILCYGTRVGIRSCQQQRYVAAFPRGGEAFDLDASGFHPFRQGDVADRASDCPSEWLLLHYSSRQHRGPVRFGDEVCFVKELSAAVGERRRDRHAYLALGPTAEGSSMEPVVDRRAGADLGRWVVVHADDTSATGPVQCGMPVLLRGKYNECLSIGKPLLGAGGLGGAGFLPPSRMSGCRLTCRGRDGKIPELRFRLVKAGVPFGVPSSAPALEVAPHEGLKSDPSADLGSMSLREQELALLEDVLFCMLGTDGVYLRRVIPASSSSAPAPAAAGARGGATPSSALSALPEVRFDVEAPPGADPSLLQFLRQALPLCEHHATLQYFVATQGQYEFGTVNHALCASIRELLREFSVKVGQLETALRVGNLTIAQLWYHIQPSMDTFALLARVAARVFGCIGGSVLSGIEEVMARSSLTSAQELCEYLMQQASRPYFEMISKWIYDGRLEDPYGELFVSESTRVRDERFGGPAADFWQKHFTLEERAVPQFMAASREKILHAGKYLHVFFSAAPNTNLPEPSERALLRYSRRRRDYTEAIDAAYRRASSALVGLFMRPAPDGLDLPGRLRSMRSFFFLGKADWFGQLMDTAVGELERPATEVPLAHFEGLLDLAIRASSAGSDPYRDDISCVMHSFRIEEACHRMTKGHALPSEDAEEEVAGARSAGACLGGRPAAPEAASRGPPAGASSAAAADGSGIRCFTLKYRTSWPLSIVFSKSMLLKYQVIFRHLLYCRYVERKLVEVWVDHQYTKELDQVRTSFAPSYSLRQRMLHFCRDYIYYVTVEVLEPQSHEFLESLANAHSIDDVLRSHERFLDTCLREILLIERDTLYRHLSKVLNTCLSFAHDLHRKAHGLHDLQDPLDGSHAKDFVETRIERAQQKNNAYLTLLSQKQYSKTVGKFKVIFDIQLSGFLRQIQQESSTRYEHFLSNLATRLDYNEYYSSVLAGAGAASMPPSLAVSQLPSRVGSRASSPGRG